MKKTTTIIMFAFALMSMTSCVERVQVKGGYESVIIDQPFFSLFGNGGVRDEPLSTGSEWLWSTSDHIELPTTPITITEEFTNMIPKDNTPVSFNAYLKIQLLKGESPKLYKSYGLAWYEQSLQQYFRTLVRNSASGYAMFDLASKREITDTLQKLLLIEVKEYATKLGLPIDIKEVIIGAITPPEQVLAETKNTAAQNQSKLTQTARASAELSRKQAETNKAIADKAYQLEMGMTIDQYQHQRQIEISKEQVELLKDHPNVTLVFGSSSYVLPTK